VIANSSADGLSEKIYFMAPTMAGDGVRARDVQGIHRLTIYRDSLKFQVGWEAVTLAVLDHLEALW